MRALPGTMWHDVMSYCTFQWLSSFTYTGIRDRLIQEDALPAGAVLPGGRKGRRGGSMAGTGAIHVVAAVNLTRGFGTVRHVTALAGVAPGRELQRARTSAQQKRAARGPSLVLRLYTRGGRTPVEFPVTFIADACRDAGDDETGVIDALLPPSRNASHLELVLNGSVVDTFVAGAAGAVRDIRQASRTARRGAESGDEDDPVLTWRPAAAVARRRGAAAGAPGPTLHGPDQHRRWTHLADGRIRAPRAAGQDRPAPAWRGPDRARARHRHERLRECQHREDDEDVRSLEAISPNGNHHDAPRSSRRSRRHPDSLLRELSGHRDHRDEPSAVWVR